MTFKDVRDRYLPQICVLLYVNCCAFFGKVLEWFPVASATIQNLEISSFFFLNSFSSLCSGRNYDLFLPRMNSALSKVMNFSTWKNFKYKEKYSIQNKRHLFTCIQIAKREKYYALTYTYSLCVWCLLDLFENKGVGQLRDKENFLRLGQVSMLSVYCRQNNKCPEYDDTKRACQRTRWGQSPHHSSV